MPFPFANAIKKLMSNDPVNKTAIREYLAKIGELDTIATAMERMHMLDEKTIDKDNPLYQKYLSLLQALHQNLEVIKPELDIGDYVKIYKLLEVLLKNMSKIFETTDLISRILKKYLEMK